RLTYQEARNAAVIERIVEPLDAAALRGRILRKSAPRGAVIGNEDLIFDRDPFGPGPLHREHLPVVDDLVILRIKEQQNLMRRLARCAGEHRRADEMGPDVASRGVVPESLHLVAAAAAKYQGRRARGGRAEFAVGAIRFDLRALLEARE